jgi:hypothetical protein
MVNRKISGWLAISLCKHRIGGSIPLFGSQHCDMARAVGLQRPPYTNLESYHAFKRSGAKELEGKKDEILSVED